MGFMTAGTRLVTLGRRSMHLGVTALAFFVDGAGVGFVAALALRVASIDLAVLPLVAVLALHLQRFGAMRQAAVTVGARRVTFERRCTLRVLRMATSAQSDPLRGQ